MPFNTVVRWEGAGGWCPCAKPPCFVSHILCPHLRLCPNGTAGPEAFLCTMHLPRRCPSAVFISFPLHTLFQLFLHKHTQTNTPQVQTVHSCPRHGGKSPLHPVLYGGFLEGDPILFPLPLRLAGWLAPVQRGVRWRGLRLGQCAQKLMNCRRDAGRQPARSSGERPSCAITDCSCDGGNLRDSADNLI